MLMMVMTLRAVMILACTPGVRVMWRLVLLTATVVNVAMGGVTWGVGLKYQYTRQRSISIGGTWESVGIVSGIASVRIVHGWREGKRTWDDGHGNSKWLVWLRFVAEMSDNCVQREMIHVPFHREGGIARGVWDREDCCVDTQHLLCLVTLLFNVLLT
jgi:hypothetical protein